MDNGNEPAYPVEAQKIQPNGEWSEPDHYGMTKREVFAAMAMQGLAADGSELTATAVKWHAEKAVELADALLAELAKGGE